MPQFAMGHGLLFVNQVLLTICCVYNHYSLYSTTLLLCTLDIMHCSRYMHNA